MVSHNEIPPLERAAADGMQLRFSFKHLDWSNPKFHPSSCCADYFVQLFLVLCKFSNWTVGDFVDQNNKERRHTIDFAKSTEPDGFQNITDIDVDQLGYQEGWQFAVHPEQPWSHWRAHGILIDDTFYIVWLDQNHLLFPQIPDKKGAAQA